MKRRLLSLLALGALAGCGPCSEKEEPVAPVYVDGRLMTTLRGETIVAEFIDILNGYVSSHYAN